MNRVLSVVAAVLIAVTTIAVTTIAGQQIFRSTVQIIEVDARVFDRDGRFVADLTRDDFELVEDGVPQQVQVLYLLDVPATRSDAAAPSAEPSSPRAPAPPPGSARQTWIFVFDLNHLTPGNGFDRAHQGVEQFIRDRLRDGDLAGVVAGDRMINNRLTSVRDELVAAVKSVKPRGETRSRLIEITREWPRFLSEDEALKVADRDERALQTVLLRACTEDPDACRDRSYVEMLILEKARRLGVDVERSTMLTLNAVNGLASGMAKIAGPKTVVLLSEGFATEKLTTTLQNVVGQTTRAGARVYAVDTRGLNRGHGAGIIDQPVADDPAGAPVQFDVGEDGPNSLAVDTGGLMIRNENNIGRALDTIAQDSSRYYVLGYQPANQTFDGKFRTIQVRVKRSGLRVRARRGYLAIEPSRLLVPQTIEAATNAPGVGAREERAATDPDPKLTAFAEASAVKRLRPTTPLSPTTPPVDTPPPADPPAVTAIGTIIAAPAGASSEMRRMRPDTASPDAPVAQTPVAQTLGRANDKLNAIAGADARSATSAAAGKNVEALAGESPGTAGEAAKKGWDAYQRGDVETALAAFSDAAARPDVRPWVLYALGLSQVALARPVDAAASWERVRQAAPEFEPVYYDLADTYAQVQEFTKALAVLREAEQRWPKSPDVHNAIGVIHVVRGALDEAVSAFSRAAEVAPAESIAYFNLGRAHQMRYARGSRYVSSQRRWVAPEDDRQKAIEFYQRYLKLGGPYATQAADAISVLEWAKR